MPTQSKRDRLLRREIDTYLTEHFIADTVVKTDMATLTKMARHFAKFGEGLCALLPDREEIVGNKRYADVLKRIEQEEEEDQIFRDCGIY